MDPETKPTNYTDVVPEASATEVTESQLALAEAHTQEVSQWQQQVTQSWDEVLEYLSAFWEEYNLLIIAVVLVLPVILVIRVVFAILGAVLGVIDEVPLLETLFELIGIGTTGWLAVRYWPLVLSLFGDREAAQISDARSSLPDSGSVQDR